jgi:hypothetical protein
MTLNFSDVHWPAVFAGRVVSRRAHLWVLQRWPIFGCAVLGIAARGGSISFPMMRMEMALAAASMSATLVLVDAWAREADAMQRGSAKAMAAAIGSALAASVGT